MQRQFNVSVRWTVETELQHNEMIAVTHTKKLSKL